MRKALSLRTVGLLAVLPAVLPLAGCMQDLAEDEASSVVEAAVSKLVSAPTNVRVVTTTSSSVSLAWDAATGRVVSYRVWRANAAMTSWVMVGEVSGTTLTYTDRTVTAGVTYHYAVRAVDKSREVSASSNTVEAVAGGTAAPSPDVDAFERPFATARWLYDAIPQSAQTDPNSAAMIDKLTSGTPVANLHEFGIPFYRADASTPRASVVCTEPWGQCALQTYGPRPLTASMLPHVGSDGAMVVIDTSPRTSTFRGATVDEYWQYRWNNGSPQTSWGGILDLGSEGRTGGATGAGFSRAAGVVRAFEIEQRRIDHALVFSTAYCQTTTVRYPASKTDGTYSGAGAIPEGARIQLDPSLDPNAYGLNAGEKAVFVALQRYGAYAMDCGAAAAAFSFEDVAGNPGAVYANAGLAWDYYGLGKIPFARARVLKSWNGQ